MRVVTEVDAFISTYGGFVLATGMGLFIAFLTWWAARKSGLNPAQETLIDTLQDNAAALNEQVRLLRESLATEQRLRLDLDAKVRHLENVVVDLASENADLRRQLGLPRKEKATAEGGA